MKRIIVQIIFSAGLMMSAVGCLQSEEPKPLPEPTADGIFAKKVWEEEILVETKDAQKSPHILDNFEIVQGIEFFPSDETNPISRRNSLIASVLQTIAGTQALDIHLTSYALIIHAATLKGQSLTEPEIKAVVSYFEEIKYKPTNKKPSFRASFNPLQNNLLYAFYEVISNFDTVNDVVERLKTINCIDLTYERIDNADFTLYKKAIDSNIPVLLEKDNVFYVGYGYIFKDGNPYIFYFDPKFVPALKARPKMLLTDLENNFSGSLDYNRGGYEQMMYINYHLSNMIPQINALEPYGRSRFIFHFITGGQLSYKAHSKKLRELLGIKKELNTKTAYPSESASEDIWNKYFLNNPFRISGVSDMVACTIVGIKNRNDMSGLYCGLVSVMDSVGSYSATEFGWYIGSFIRFTRQILGQPFEYLPDTEVAALQKILDRKKLEYSPQSYSGVHYENSAYYRAAIRLMEVVKEREATEIKDVLIKIATQAGWVATAEGTKTLPFDKYCESIHKNIPVLMYGPILAANISEKRWFIGFGYYVENGKNYMAMADSSKIEGVIKITRSITYPNEEGIYFEEYVPNRYISYMIYNWGLSDAGIRKEIAEIAANHGNFIEEQKQAELNMYWDILISKDRKEEEIQDAFSQLSLRNDPRIKDIAIDWITNPIHIENRVWNAIGAISRYEEIEMLEYIRKKLSDDRGNIKGAAYMTFVEKYTETKNIIVKQYIFSIRNEIINAIKTMPNYQKNINHGNSRYKKDINYIESWREDDPVAKPELDQNTSNKSISITQGKVEETPLYPELTP